MLGLDELLFIDQKLITPKKLEIKINKTDIKIEEQATVLNTAYLEVEEEKSSHQSKIYRNFSDLERPDSENNSPDMHIDHTDEEIKMPYDSIPSMRTLSLLGKDEIQKITLRDS